MSAQVQFSEPATMIWPPASAAGRRFESFVCSEPEPEGVAA
jgi:hypothetical protein